MCRDVRRGPVSGPRFSFHAESIPAFQGGDAFSFPYPVLYLHVEMRAAFRTGDPVLSLDARKAQDRFAGGTLFVDVRLSVPELVFLQLEKAADRPEKADEALILGLARREIPGKEAKDHPGKQRVLDHHQGHGVQEEIHQKKRRRKPEQRIAQCVESVPSVQKRV